MSDPVRARREPVHPRPPTPPPGGAPKRGLSDLQLGAHRVDLVPGCSTRSHRGTRVSHVVVITFSATRILRLIEKGCPSDHGLRLAAGARSPCRLSRNESTRPFYDRDALVDDPPLGRLQISEALASISGTFSGLMGLLLSHAVVCASPSRDADRY